MGTHRALLGVSIGTKGMHALAALAAVLVLVQLPAVAGYITYANGSVLDIESLWPPERGVCCYDMPPDAVVSMDSHYGIYTEFGCPLGKRTCKWSTPANPVIIKSIWVCDCPAYGHPWENITLTTTCCANSRVGATPAAGKTNATAADQCTTFNTSPTLEYGYYGTPSNFTCHYDASLGIVTGLFVTWSRGNTTSRSAQFGGAWGANVSTLLMRPGQFITTLGVSTDPVTGYISGIRAVTDRVRTWSCGNVTPNEVVYSGYSALRPVNANLSLAQIQDKYKEYVGAFAGTTCVLNGQPVLGTLAAVWGRDMTYYSYPGFVNGVPYVDPDTIAVPVNNTPVNNTPGSVGTQESGNGSTIAAATNTSKEHTTQHMRLMAAVLLLWGAAAMMMS